MISTYINPYEYICPVCGLRESMTDSTTTSMIENGRRTSREEVWAYQQLYGELVKKVEHYKT